jgi:hypothetical protein
MSRKYCNCEDDPYSCPKAGPDWDVCVTDRGEAVCRACGFDIRPEVVAGVKARATHAAFIRVPHEWLWVVAETAPERHRLENFHPRPTFLRRSGTRLTAGWKLIQPLEGTWVKPPDDDPRWVCWTEHLNRRLARRMGCTSRFVEVEPSIPDRDDPDTVWTDEIHSARAVAGGLPDATALRQARF